ncbi:MAG: hypothetical protein ACE5GX_01285 [Thermoanaerobaculia bacterium]
MIGLLWVGCLPKSHTAFRLQPRGPEPPGAAALRSEILESRPHAAETIDHWIREAGGYAEHRLSFASIGYNAQHQNLVEATYFERRTPGRKALVIILPIWGSSSYPGRALLRQLRRDDAVGDMSFLLIHGREYLFDWEGMARASSEAALRGTLATSVEAMLNSIQDARRLLTWAVERPEVDPSRIAIAGFSSGAIVAAITMGVDRRIGTGVFVMGGADPHEIFSTCSSHARTSREAVRRNLGWSLDQFRATLEGPLSAINPRHYVSSIDPANVLVVEASADRCIGDNPRREFWTALGRPEKISVLGGHRHSFLSMTPLGRHWTTRRISEFLRRKLAARPMDSVPIAAR